MRRRKPPVLSAVHRRHVFVISALLVGAILASGQPVRHGVLSFLRFPFTLTKTFVSAAMLVPRLPSLSRENTGLRTALMAQQEELAQMREALRRAQGITTLSVAHAARGLAAHVIGRSTVPTQHTVLLDRGRGDGLTMDTVLVDAEGVVGRVVELSAATALVMLLTDPESRVAGLIERSRETGSLVGQGHGICELRYLDVAADVQEGDRVLTAGLGGAFPKGLPLGFVIRVLRDEVSGSAVALVKPAAHLGRLEEAWCLSTPDGTEAAR